jgi:hypothetical protein
MTASEGKQGAAMKFIVSAVALISSLIWSAFACVSVHSEELRSGKVTIEYFEPRNPKYQAVYEQMKKRRVLEEYAEFLSPVRLPVTLRVWALSETPNSSCDYSPYYDPTYRAMHMCYQFMDELKQMMPKETTADGFTPREALIGAYTSVILHETGHALYDLLDVPVLGREEDAADQIAAFVGLQFGKDVARLVTKGAAWLWLSWSNRVLTLPSNPAYYRDPHSTNQERFFNFLCYGYGGDPALFKDLADRFLPRSRAPSCAREYEQIRFAFAKTILPHVDPDLLKKVRARQFFTAEELK